MGRSVTPEEKVRQKREVWAERTARVFDISVSDAKVLLRQERRQSLRLNPLAGDVNDTLSELRAIGWHGTPYDWAPDCYSVDCPLEVVRDSEAVASGQAFIQNAASWLPVLVLDPRPAESVLDICAAPGGKASHIAALTDNKAGLWVNDNSRTRLAKMRANFLRLSVTPEATTLFDATNLVRKLGPEQLFDKILLDAPCSGEGMMRYDRDKDFAMWSVAQIKRLQALQKRILAQAWQLLKPGGVLVYSTCTIAPEENEAVVDYWLRTHPDASTKPIPYDVSNRVSTVRFWNDKVYQRDVQHCLRLAPSSHIEAFFVCKFQKSIDPVDTKSDMW